MLFWMWTKVHIIPLPHSFFPYKDCWPNCLLSCSLSASHYKLFYLYYLHVALLAWQHVKYYFAFDLCVLICLFSQMVCTVCRLLLTCQLQSLITIFWCFTGRHLPLFDDTVINDSLKCFDSTSTPHHKAEVLKQLKAPTICIITS